MYRSAQEDSAISFHNDVLVGHSGYIGTTGGAATQNEGDLGNTSWGKLCHVVEDPTEMSLGGEYIALSWQIGSSWVYQVETWEFVFQGDLLSPEMFFDCYRIVRSAK